METQRLTADHVKLGIPLPGDVYDEAGRLLLSTGFVITDQPMLEALLERGMYVDIRTLAAFHRGSNEVPEAERTFDPFQIRDSLRKRLNRVLRTLHETADASGQITALAAAIHELAATDAEGAIASVILDEDESYAIRHSLQAAVLAELTATALGWPDGRRLSAVCAALTMNAAMLDLQNRLVGQATPLTPQQQELVRAHAFAAVDLLRRAGVTDGEWLAAVQEHHEHRGGDGYPAGVAQPGEIAQLLHIVDTFGALSSPRGDRRAQVPPQAIRTIFALEGQGPQAAIVGALVRVLGVFPPGTFVTLVNHETAVVCRHGAAANAPLVASVTSGSGNRYMKPVPRDTGHKEMAITGLVARDGVSVGYDLGTLWVKRIQ